MENIISNIKVNRSLFAYRVVDVHNDEFGFAQNGVIYTYITENNAKTKGSAWLRMQRAGESDTRGKYLLFFGDETEPSAIMDKHNDIYDLEGNYIASLIHSKFILFIVIFVALIVLLTGLAMYLGSTMISDTSTPFSQDQTIHIEGSDSTDGRGSSEVDINLLDPHGTLSGDTDNDDVIVWPGYVGDFDFYVQNDGDTPLTYQISFDEENVYDVPMRFKLKADDVYVIGDEDTWCQIAEFDLTKQQIVPGDTVKYTIIFEWEDENTEESNAHDTELGVEGIAEFVLHTTVYFEDLV